MQAKDVMTAPVLTVSPQASVEEVAGLMLKHRISGIPVVDAKGRLQGMVSEGDLIQRVASGSQSRRSWWLALLTNPDEKAFAYMKSRGRTAGDVMSAEIVTVGERTPLATIAALLERHHIKRVPVVRGGRIVGIVSRANLLHGLAGARPAANGKAVTDRKLRAQIIDELVRAGVDRYHFNLVVSDGVVEFWGFVDTQAQKRAMAVAARNVEGVKKVVDNTTVPSPMLRASLGSA